MLSCSVFVVAIFSNIQLHSVRENTYVWVLLSFLICWTKRISAKRIWAVLAFVWLVPFLWWSSIYCKTTLSTLFNIFLSTFLLFLSFLLSIENLWVSLERKNGARSSRCGNLLYLFYYSHSYYQYDDETYL